MALAITAQTAAPALAQSPHTHGHSFGDAEKWAKVFDDPKRDAWQKPDEVIRSLALAPDAAVADIGAGTGYFAVRLARALPKGKVIGVDISQSMVRYLDARAKREGLANVAAQLGTATDPRLDAPVDLVILVDTYHHIGAREKYFRRVREALNPGGRLVIIDFRAGGPVGPEHGLIPPAQVKKELAAAGFELAQEHDFLPHQFFLEFRPTADKTGGERRSPR